jgi:sulfate permease, SulP family
LDSANRSQHHQAPPSFAELFTPKLITVLREGYGRTKFQADVIAGLTVAIVALPLSMAIQPSSAGSSYRRWVEAVSRLAVLRALSSCLSPRPWTAMASMV